MSPTTQVRACAHPGCKCLVSEDTEYCGEYCKNASSEHASEQEFCRCGHQSCKSDVAVDPRQQTAA